MTIFAMTVDQFALFCALNFLAGFTLTSVVRVMVVGAYRMVRGMA